MIAWVHGDANNLGKDKGKGKGKNFRTSYLLNFWLLNSKVEVEEKSI